MTPSQPSSNPIEAAGNATNSPPSSPAGSLPKSTVKAGDKGADWTPGLRHSKRTIPAWLFSCLLHVVVCSIGLLLFARFDQGGGDVETRSGGIVLVNALDSVTEYLDQGDVDSPADAAPDQALAAIEFVREAPPELPGPEAVEQPIVGAGDALLDSLGGGEAMLNGNGGRNAPGGQVTTEMFGVAGTGSRFVYVVDHSQSMSDFGGRPMLAAKEQLLKSIASLSSTSQFQIVFYNNRIRIFNPDGQLSMYQATPEFKEEAKRFVDRTRPDGGTDHVNALRQAMRLRPDVIFLLTDAEGGFSSKELRDLSDRNRSGATINAIEFGTSVGRDRSLERVARESGGSYLFKNITTLKLAGER